MLGLGFLLLRCHCFGGGGKEGGQKNDFWVGKIIFLKLETGGAAGVSPFSAWQTARKTMIFGPPKSFLQKWSVAIAGICWDFFFCGVTASWGGEGAAQKKNDFWVGKIIFLKLETRDCRGFSFFCMADCPEKCDFFGSAKIICAKLECGDCWGLLGFLLFAVSTASWGGRQKNMIFGSGKSFFGNWRMAMADLLGFLRLRRLFCC